MIGKTIMKVIAAGVEFVPQLLKGKNPSGRQARNGVKFTSLLSIASYSAVQLQGAAAAGEPVWPWVVLAAGSLVVWGLVAEGRKDGKEGEG